MAKENKKQWYYIYTTGCGPCGRVSPIIDAVASCGLNIQKIQMDEFRKRFSSVPFRGTPSILCIDSNNEQCDQIPSNIIAPLVELSSSAPDLLTKTFGELLNEKVSS